MIASQEILCCLQGRPFRRFRVQMASGDTFDIRHPEMAHLDGNCLRLSTLVSEKREVADRWETLPLELMQSVSYLDAAAPPAGN